MPVSNLVPFQIQYCKRKGVETHALCDDGHVGQRASSWRR
jgi:hypothetical protein